jgi:hypothetical protein
MHIALAGRMSDLQASDTLTMFHGTDETEAKKFLLSGIDGTKVVGRVHNQGHERGLYVTPSIKCARDFGSEPYPRDSSRTRDVPLRLESQLLV